MTIFIGIQMLQQSRATHLPLTRPHPPNPPTGWVVLVWDFENIIVFQPVHHQNKKVTTGA